MFENVSAKIKVLARAFFFIIWVGGTIIGIYLSVSRSSGGFLLFVPASFLIGWLDTILMYAFGELCENVERIAKHTPVLPEKIQRK